MWEVKQSNWWSCFSLFQSLDMTWFPENFLVYIKEAERRWGQVNEYHLCEMTGPLSVREPLWFFQVEGNWMACEPEEVNYCNQDPECSLSPNGPPLGRTEKPYDPLIVVVDYNSK